MKRSGVTQTNARSLRFRRLQLAWLGVAIIGLLFSYHVRGASLPTGFSEQAIGGTWNEAVGLLFEDDGRMYVWERAGRVWIVENGVKSSSPLIDIHEEAGGWRDFGLLGFALDPNFRANGYIYLLTWSIIITSRSSEQRIIARQPTNIIRRRSDASPDTPLVPRTAFAPLTRTAGAFYLGKASQTGCRSFMNRTE